MENKIIAIGELLIDFLGDGTDGLKASNCFIKNAGGAPANVAACVAKLGGKAEFITKLGKDAFGDFLIDVLKDCKVGVGNIKRTDKANTPLAFVSLDKGGDRQFSFYRKPSSDLLLEPSEIDESIFNEGDILHFCSVDLVDYPVRKAHDKAISYAIKHNMIVSFDPNLRYNLWDSREELINVVNNYIEYAHILKVSEEELTDITSEKDENKGVNMLFRGNVKVVIVTRGGKGASLYFSKDERCNVKTQKVQVVDTTGAGDTFIGTFLFQLLKYGIVREDILKNKEILKNFLNFANKAATLSVQSKGAIPSMPEYNKVFNSM
jgi:fructokinase